MLGHLSRGPAVLVAEVDKGPWAVNVRVGKSFVVSSAPVVDDPVSELARGILNVTVGEALRMFTTVAVWPMVECSIDYDM